MNLDKTDWILKLKLFYNYGLKEKKFWHNYKLSKAIDWIFSPIYRTNTGPERLRNQKNHRKSSSPQQFDQNLY